MSGDTSRDKSVQALAPSFGDPPTLKTYLVHTASSTPAGRTWVGSFGFQSSGGAVRRGRSARIQEMDDVLRGMQEVLDSMPAQETEPGAMDDLLQEIDELAPGRRAATSILLGDAE